VSLSLLIIHLLTIVPGFELKTGGYLYWLSIALARADQLAG